jgi:hypothetical protein
MWGWLEKTLTWLGVNTTDARPEVVSTDIAIDNYAQADGSRWVLERHTLDNGEAREFYYLCAPEDEPEAIATGRAQSINDELAAAEPSPEPTADYLG